jgi:hypothetical protein
MNCRRKDKLQEGGGEGGCEVEVGWGGEGWGWGMGGGGWVGGAVERKLRSKC